MTIVELMSRPRETLLRTSAGQNDCAIDRALAIFVAELFVARIAQMITIVFRSVLIRPHRRPPLESGPPFLKSQPIQPIQQVLGRTLSSTLANLDNAGESAFAG